jgi:hypothetical protein
MKIIWKAQDINIGNSFLARTPTAQEIRARIDKWDCIKVKGFCTAKETTTRGKRHFTG